MNISHFGSRRHRCCLLLLSVCTTTVLTGHLRIFTDISYIRSCAEVWANFEQVLCKVHFEVETYFLSYCRYLDFASHHLLAYKIAVTRTLHSKAQVISSAVLGKDEETKCIKQALSINGYPREVIQHHSTHINYRRADQEDKQNLVVTLPNVWCVRSNEAYPDLTRYQGLLPTKCDRQL